MITSQTFRLTSVLVALLFTAACEDESLITSSGYEAGVAAEALSFDGPSKTTFAIGEMQTVSYYAVHLGGHSFDLEVSSCPEGAIMEIVDQSSFQKRVTLHWNPGHDAEGTLHPVSLSASSGASEWTGEFGIYVALEEVPGYDPLDVDDDEPKTRENKAVGTRK